MPVDQFALEAYRTLVSWTYVLLVILLIVKAIQFVSGRGFSGSRETTRPGTSTSDNVSPDDNRQRNELGRLLGAQKGLDVKHPGFVRILVMDENGNFLPGARISIIPARMRKRKWHGKTKGEWREYGGTTGPDGTWPGGGQFANVGAGSVVIKVKKKDYMIVSWLFNKTYYQEKDFEILPNEKHEIIIVMARKGEEDEAFEPHIENIEFEKDRTKLTGKVVA